MFKKGFIILMLLLLHQILAAQIKCSCDSDADGDGISGCFDRCPNTPAGATVDSHGCPMDTDGDGVADYLDKQLITPTECQPVNKEGVGICPQRCPENNANKICGATISSLLIHYEPNRTSLKPYAIAALQKLGDQMRQTPGFRILITASTLTATKREQLDAWRRLNAVREYLTQHAGIDRERLLYKIVSGGKNCSVDVGAAPEGFAEDGQMPAYPGED